MSTKTLYISGSTCCIEMIVSALDSRNVTPPKPHKNILHTYLGKVENVNAVMSCQSMN